MTRDLPHSMLRIKRQAPPCPLSGKQSYRTKKKALKFAERSKQIETEVYGAKGLFVYRCPCGNWHLTSRPQRAKAAA